VPILTPSDMLVILPSSSISHTLYVQYSRASVKNRSCFDPSDIMTQSTYMYIYRAQSSVWRLPNYWPHTPLHPASVSSPEPKAEGTHSQGGEGVGVNISEDARHWIGLLQYNPSTQHAIWKAPAVNA
jgi:hypothetical protein